MFGEVVVETVNEILGEMAGVTPGVLTRRSISVEKVALSTPMK